MTLKLFILAVLFVISGGAAFSEYFKGHKFISFLAMMIAIVATFYLFQDIYDDLKQPSSSTQVPEVESSPPVVVLEKPPEKAEILPQPEVESSSSVVVPEKSLAKTEILPPPEFEPSSSVVVQENPPEKAEIPPIKIAKGDFTAYFQPKQKMFETSSDLQARRHKLLQQFNDEVKQRNLDYQAGVLHLTDYNADTQMFTVDLDWQADWVKQLFGELQNKSKVQIGVEEAKQIYNEGTKKPLFITAKLKDNKVKIQAAILVENGRAYSILWYRYIDNGDGTVTDNRTRLIWLKNANCFDAQNWETAMQSTADLASGQCGLHDGSKRSMWRLPSQEEWEIMIDKKYGNKENHSQFVLSNAAGTGPWKEGDAFLGIQRANYWSSTTISHYIKGAWCLFFQSGDIKACGKRFTYNVWPVRDGY